MNDYYCFDISFPSVDFDAYEQGSEKTKSIHHAHLFSKENEIEIRICFEPRTGFDRKFIIWAGRLNWSKFGSHVVCSNETQNHLLQRIDLSHSTLSGVEYVGGDFPYVAVRIDI